MAARKKKGGLFSPIKPKGGVGGRRNPNIRTQIDEFGNPITAPPKEKLARRKKKK
jgi:hypothetical protein